jgi:hypothetical protein
MGEPNWSTSITRARARAEGRLRMAIAAHRRDETGRTQGFQEGSAVVSTVWQRYWLTDRRIGKSARTRESLRNNPSQTNTPMTAGAMNRSWTRT